MEKIRQQHDWSVDNFDAMEVRCSKSPKYGGAKV